jgi:ribosome-binding protein aMBF1 (putative translation factor)
MGNLFSEDLRQAIENCGASRYRIAKDTSISQQTLSRFMSGERGLTLSAVDTLIAYLGLKLVTEKEGPRQKRQK